jgi:ribose transport system substrate-binding protein
VQITKGAELEARKLAGDNVKVTLVSSGYDLGQQVAQIDNFIAAKVDMIILNAADSKGIGPAVKRAKDAGIVWWRLTWRRKGLMQRSLPITPRRGNGL